VREPPSSGQAPFGARDDVAGQAARGGHRNIVCEHGSLETQIAAQDTADPARRCARRELVHGRKLHVGHHDARQPVVDEAPVGRQIVAQVLERTSVDGQGEV